MYDRSRDVPGAAVADIVTGRFDDTRKLARFARGVDVVTFDWENVPVSSARAIARIRPVWPPPRALEVGAGPPVREAALRAPRHSGRALRRRRPRSRISARAIAALGAARHPEDAPPRIRRQGAGPHRPASATRRRPTQRLAGQAAHLRTVGEFLARGLAHRGTRPGRRRGGLPARRERARRRHPRGDPRALAGRGAATPRPSATTGG